jgi:opacity protein-like surface antigen
MRKTIHATAVALAALLAGGSLTARAADMTMAPIYQPESGPMVEFGSGWYLRGDVAYGTLSTPTIGGVPALQIGQISYPLGGLYNNGIQSDGVFGATLGGGYQFNPWFRMDTTLDYRQELVHNIHSEFSPYTAGGVNYTGCFIDTTVAGVITPTPTGDCYRVDSTTMTSWTGLLNAYGDLGKWFGVTPYLGGGVGLTNIRTTSAENWFWGSGLPYGVGNNYTSSTGVSFHYGYRGNVGPSQNLTNFSWALMAGLSYDIAPHIKLDVGYRYLNMGSVTSINSAGNPARVAVDAQEVRAGLRFTPDQ